MKIYHQQAVNLDNSDQNNDFIFGEKITYHQITNAYLQYGTTVEEDASNPTDRKFIDGDAIGPVKNAFAGYFKETGLAITRGQDLEHNKNIGQVSTTYPRIKEK